MSNFKEKILEAEVILNDLEKKFKKIIQALPKEYTYDVNYSFMFVINKDGKRVASIPKSEANKVDKWLEEIKNFKDNKKDYTISTHNDALKLTKKN